MANHHELMDIISGKSNNKHNVLGNKLVTAAFDYFIRQMPGALYYKDKKGKYLGCSNYLLTASGFNSEQDIIGKTDSDLFSDEQSKALRRNDKKVMAEGKTLVTEEKITLPNGDTQYFEVVKTPLREISGKIVGLIGNSIEITDRVKAEQKLVVAKEKAELANKAKNQFIANMEHDLRTPCSGIAQMVNILAKQEADKEKKESLGYVAGAAKQLLEILNGILEFDHIESGKLAVLYKKFNLRRLLDEVAAIEMPSIKSKQLKLDINYEAGLPEMFIGDAFRISRILINLVSNAVKFTSNGYIKLTVNKARKISNKHVVLRIMIEDTGIGIPQDKQDIIYSRFTRVHPSNKGLYKGSGLGLCIVKQFIEELEGEIEVTSEVGKGTVFECLLPLEIPLLTGKKKQINGESKVDVPEKVRGNLKILLVEDDLLAQRVASIMLREQFTKTLDLAASGKEALKFTKENKYDLIFMDIGLPDITGCEVTKQIRSDKKNLNKNTVIVALTAHDASEAQEETAIVGMDDFLVKPINEEKTYNIITHYVHKKTKERTSRKKVRKTTKGENATEKRIKNDAINMELATELAGGNSKLALELLEMLVQSLPDSKKKINNLAKAKKSTELGKAAHKLHGAVCYCGTARLKHAVKELELAAKNEQNKKIPLCIKELNLRIEEVLNDYDGICRKLKESC